MRVAVIGAGVAGLVTAVELTERGIAVEVIERNARLGADCCSWHAGGMLAPWCELETAEPLVARLGEEAIGWWTERFPGTLRNGSLVLAQSRDAGELDRFARRTARFEWVDATRIAELEPDLEGRFGKGLFFPDEAHLDPRQALAALLDRLLGLGGSVRFGTDGGSSTGRANRIIDCRGLAARDALPDLRGVKGEMLLIRSSDVRLSRPVRLLHPRHPLYVVPRGRGLYMVGATMIESDDRRVTARSVLELLSAAYALHPAFGEAEIVEIGADVRPAFPDNLPRIRRRGSTLFVNGLYRHGFLLAPALARMAADAVLDESYIAEVMDEDHGQRRSA